jgi:hypothetical protein
MRHGRGIYESHNGHKYEGMWKVMQRSAASALHAQRIAMASLR